MADWISIQPTGKPEEPKHVCDLSITAYLPTNWLPIGFRSGLYDSCIVLLAGHTVFDPTEDHPDPIRTSLVSQET